MTSRLIARPLMAAAMALAAAGAAQADPVIWVDDNAGRLGRVDVASGAVTVVGSMGLVMADIAFDPMGNLFGTSGSSLYSINTATAAATLVGSLGATVTSLVFSTTGTLYGSGTGLYSISPTSGTATFIGNAGITYGFSGDLAFAGGTLYLSSGSQGPFSLSRLDTGTGARTLIGSLGVPQAYGLASPDRVNVYTVGGTRVFTVNLATGAALSPVDFGGRGLSAINGAAFITEAAPVPEPGRAAMLLSGLAVVVLLAQRRLRRDKPVT